MIGLRFWRLRARRDWLECQPDVNPAQRGAVGATGRALAKRSASSRECHGLVDDRTHREAHPPPVWGALSSRSHWAVDGTDGLELSTPPQAGHANARKRRFLVGSGWSGPALKKSQKRRSHLNLYRRKRPEPEAAPCTHMESQRPDPNLGIQLQLEEAFGHRRTVLVEFLLSPLPRGDQDRANIDLGEIADHLVNYILPA